LKLTLKILVFLAGLISLAMVLLLWYLFLTYIDETTNVGSAYGYTIGQSNDEVFAAAVAQFASSEITGIHIDEPFETFEAVETNFPRVESSESWTLFPGEKDDFFDVLKLRFANGELAEIHRHRQRFELP
jgi:hypothetical protein